MASLPDEKDTTYGDVLAEYAAKYNPIVQKTAEPRKPAANGAESPRPPATAATGAENLRPPPMSPFYEDLLSSLVYDLPETENTVGGSLPVNTEVDYEYDYGKEPGYLSGEEGSEEEKYDDFIGSRSRLHTSTRSTGYAFGGASALSEIRDQLIDVDTSVATLEDRVIEIKALGEQTGARVEGNAHRLEDLGRDVVLLRDQVGRIEATLAALLKILLEPAGLEKAKQYAGARQ